LTPSPLPAALAISAAPTLSGCIGNIAGLARPTTVATSGAWSLGLSNTNYAGALNAPAGGIAFTVGTCSFSTGAAAVAVSLRSAVNGPVALGQPASRLAVTGLLPVPASCGSTATTMSMVADGTALFGATSGTYGLGGSITEF
jgi:hypothetical protein